MAEAVTLTREEYEALIARGPAKQTITVDAAEYNELVGLKPAHEKLKHEYNLSDARRRELEACLRREQREHAEECNAMLKRIKQLGG